MSKRPVGFVKPQVFENILQQLISVGIKGVGLHTVGEPFMNNKLESLLEIANHYNFNVWISMNAQFPSRIEQIYKNFPSLVNYYRLSIDSATKKSYESIRSGGKYENIVDSLEVIQKINNKKRNYRISLLIDSILSSSNIYEIPIFFEKYGKYCFPENINFTIVNGLSPDPSYFRESFPFPNLIRQNIPCHMPFKKLYFTYGGKVTLCCRDYDEDIVVGDIQQDSLIDIWNGVQADQVRKKHLDKKKMDIRSCKSCYGPYRSISFVINEYIHSLYAHKPDIGSHGFGENIIQLLEKLDLAMANKNIGKLHENIHNAFARIN
jgi:radical SAM protein with 4Fe4S-binding SPASM domain